MGKIRSFIGIDQNLFDEYNFFDIKFNICNYIFMIPAELSLLFDTYYSLFLNKSLLFSPKNSKEAIKILNSYKIKGDNRDNWIIIAPCIILEKNIKMFDEDKNVSFIIGYCPIFNHEHNFEFLYKFKK